MTTNILIATNNPHKVKKITDMLAGLESVSIDTPRSAGLDIEVDESGETFEENAVLKAVEYSQRYDGLVIATDGGMNIPHLPDWEAIRTKRFAGDHATDEDRIRDLLTRMRDKVGAERQMTWREAVAVAKNGKKLFSIEVPGAGGLMSINYDPAKYREGIWLCSIWQFPQFDNKNFFDLTTLEVAEVEISWSRLGSALRQYLLENEYFSHISS